MAYYRIKEEVLEQCLSPSYLNETKQYFLYIVFSKMHTVVSVPNKIMTNNYLQHNGY